MTDHYCNFPLDIDNCLRVDLKDYILSNPYRDEEHAIYLPEAGGIWTIDPKTIFTKQWCDYVERGLGIELDIAQIFMRKPGYQHPGAHIDISKDHTVHGGGINWTLDPDDADMVWYKYPDTTPTINQRSITDINWEWPLESLTESARTTIGQTATLVRTDVPHTVNMRNNERWLVSLRTLSAKTWQQHLELKERLDNELLA